MKCFRFGFSCCSAELDRGHVSLKMYVLWKPGPKFFPSNVSMDATKHESFSFVQCTFHRQDTFMFVKAYVVISYSRYLMYLLLVPGSEHPFYLFNLIVWYVWCTVFSKLNQINCIYKLFSYLEHVNIATLQINNDLESCKHLYWPSALYWTVHSWRSRLTACTWGLSQSTFVYGRMETCVGQKNKTLSCVYHMNLILASLAEVNLDAYTFTLPINHVLSKKLCATGYTHTQAFIYIHFKYEGPFCWLIHQRCRLSTHTVTRWKRTRKENRPRKTNPLY